MEEAMNFRPDLASSLVDRTMLVEVFLLSRIDALWWGDTPTFQTDSDICGTSNWSISTPCGTCSDFDSATVVSQ